MGATHQALLMASVASVNHALSIYNKLAEWWTCDADGATITGAHAATSASKIVSTGSVSATTGHLNNALNFAPDCLYRATSLPFTPATGSLYSLGVWLRADSLPVGAIAPLCLGESTNQNATDRALQMIVLSNGALYARAGNDVGGFTDATGAAGKVTTGAWKFLQAERGTNYVRCRVNAGSWATASITANLAPVNSQAISIGGDYNSTSSLWLNCVDGLIDEAFVATSVLTDDEWDYLYASGSGISYGALEAAAGF